MYEATYEKTNLGKVHVHVYEGVAEHVASVFANQNDPRANKYKDAIDANFIGRKLANWKEIASAVTSPWPEGVAIIEEMQAKIDKSELPKPVSIRRRPRWKEDCGDEISLDRYREGQDYWRKSERARMIGPAVLTVAVDVCANCDVSARDVFWRGALALCMSRILEEAGYSVELWAYNGTRGTFTSGDSSVQTVLVKGSGDYLDIHSLANAVSAWYFRTVTFGGCYTFEGQTPVGHLGSHMRITPEALSHLGPRPESIMVIDECWKLDACVEAARKYLQTLSQE